MTTFQSESVGDVWDDALPLIRAHGSEIPIFKDGADPSRRTWEQMYETGMLKIFTARVDGKLVGYAAFFVSRNHKAPSEVWATQEVLYVVPEHRGRLAMRFLAWQETALTRLGCSVLMRATTVWRDYGRALRRLGYEEIGTTYARRLDA